MTFADWAARMRKLPPWKQEKYFVRTPSQMDKKKVGDEKKESFVAIITLEETVIIEDAVHVIVERKDGTIYER